MTKQSGCKIEEPVSWHFDTLNGAVCLWGTSHSCVCSHCAEDLQQWLRRMYAHMYCYTRVVLVYMSIALQCLCSTGMGLGLFGRSPVCFGCRVLRMMLPLFILWAALWNPMWDKLALFWCSCSVLNAIKRFPAKLYMLLSLPSVPLIWLWLSFDS